MMEALPVTIADIAIVGFVALAGLLAFAWGFVRVVLVIAAWAGAGVVAMLLFPDRAARSCAISSRAHGSPTRPPT